jgi:hypothetical protein
MSRLLADSHQVRERPFVSQNLPKIPRRGAGPKTPSKSRSKLPVFACPQFVRHLAHKELTPLTAVATVMLNDMAHWSIITSVTPSRQPFWFSLLSVWHSSTPHALFAKPSTSQGKKRKQEVINGFQLAGGILLGFVLLGGLVGFAGIAFGATSTSLRVSQLFAGAIAVSALVVIGLMVQRWAKYFAGWIAWGILNSLMMASSGHLDPLPVAERDAG